MIGVEDSGRRLSLLAHWDDQLCRFRGLEQVALDIGDYEAYAVLGRRIDDLEEDSQELMAVMFGLSWSN